MLDVGPANGDSILIVSPTGKTVLIDAGDTGKGKAVLEALKRNNIQQLDYFIATHPHPDHLGGADEVFKAIKVLNVIDNGLGPDVPESLAPPKPPEPTAGKKRRSPNHNRRRNSIRPELITKFYNEYKEAVTLVGAQYEKAVPGAKYDLGGGAGLTILGPNEPLFTRDKMSTGGNLPNANSVVARLDYGDFSMFLPGDAEDQTEHQLLTKELNLKAKILKVAHHGSKYATSSGLPGSGQARSGNCFLWRVESLWASGASGDWID